MPKRYWYVILTYLLMQLSGVPAAPVIMSLDVNIELAMVYWSVFSFLAGLVIILYLLREDIKEGSAPGASGFGGIVLWSVLGLFLAYFSQILSSLIEIFVLNVSPASENTTMIMEVARSAPVFILIITVFAPIMEEIIFRKIIFGSIYKRTNFFLAALASGLLFAVVHNDFSHLLTYTAMGFVFAFLYVQTKRIIVPIIAHALMNTFTVIAQFSIDPEELERQMQQLEQLQTILIGG